MASGTLGLYRTLIPGHNGVAEDVVQEFLKQASARHNAAAFGGQFSTAMVYFAAHLIEMTPGMPGISGRTAAEVGQVVQQADGAANRAYAVVQSMNMSDRAQWLRSTVYGQAFLSIESTLVARTPLAISPGGSSA